MKSLLIAAFLALAPAAQADPVCTELVMHLAQSPEGHPWKQGTAGTYVMAGASFMIAPSDGGTTYILTFQGSEVSRDPCLVKLYDVALSRVRDMIAAGTGLE